MSRPQLKEFAQYKWDKPNEWLAFKELYITFYNPYYKQRFDRSIESGDREVEIAYEFWSRQSPP